MIEKAMTTHPVLLPGRSHGGRSLVGCSPWGRKESDTTERLPFHFSLSCIGEGNGNPLQCSCMENPSDGGAWWVRSMRSHRVGHDRSNSAAAAALLMMRKLLSVEFISATQSYPTLRYPMDCKTPGFPVHHQLPQLTQTPVHRVSDIIHPLSSPSPTFNLSHHQNCQ